MAQAVGEPRLPCYSPKKAFRLLLWAYGASFAEKLQRERENTVYLKGIPFPENIQITNSEALAAESADMLVVATPAQAVRETLHRIHQTALSGKTLVNLSKGIEVKTGLRISQVIRQVHPEVQDEQIAILYGPSHAEEVCTEHPTTVVAASTCLETAKLVQDTFITPMFRVYVNDDVIGVEIGGSVKNIMAIAAGISDGLGFGDNAKAAIITRGIAEISRLGARLGANPLTFAGLAGIGDLVVTCSSRHSRNRYVGEMIGKGKSLDEIIQSMEMIAEGVETTRAVAALSKELNVDMPITQSVYEMLFEGKPVKQAVYELMTRDPKFELS
ncbi:Glycerol-3-phosphate dehydrogenase (NAD(P)(+)) [Chloroherpeton thalassium ATCC 35110]|uniref:Glycerol-3-phosphate dehydrogenase [NAD(P)+] n=1 Tax=Chloroherpeton thalassium (strain ATCC 35110 / GB-78) TaxID=517418 RepID=B3QSB0_CHLT3|nr:Glycerol-3-phosphate dehydrogenase (NAD(P)(+)) [Chloroherpeton thalassium ATCC 35110]